MKKFTLLSTLTAVAMGCAGETGPVEGARAEALEEVQAPTLNTFIGESLEIDMLGNGPGDANMFVGDDPADGSASAELPAGGPLPFLDWDDLGGDLENHQLLDLNNEKGRDESSFPRSNECVGDSKVLSKMDLTYVGMANNPEYAYIAVQRSNNNGDAGYYWLFTNAPPHRNADEAPCHPGEHRLLYDITGGPESEVTDVLLVGHFRPSAGPLLRFFRAVDSRSGVPATDVLDFTDATLWEEDPTMIAAAAVNSTDAAAGALGAAGVIAASGDDVEPEIVTEAAVRVEGFTGGNNCGASFYGSIITRSSGAGGTSPDLKDLAGPAVFNFGSTTAEATVTPTCTDEVQFAATGTGMDGQPVANPECAWEFGDGAGVSADCAGTLNLPVGSHAATVTVADPVSGCSDTLEVDAVQVYPPLGVTADLTPQCDLTFDYAATPSGGSGNYQYAWTFTGGGDTHPSGSDQASGSVGVSQGGTAYSGTIVLSDVRPDGLVCQTNDADEATPFAPIEVSLALAPLADSCTSDAATYSAQISGGSGDFGLTWNGPSGGPCAGMASCTIDPDNALFCGEQTLSLTVVDQGGLCAPADSETESYTKITTIEATDH